MHTDAFAPYTLAADLLELGHLFANLFERLGAPDWARHTEGASRGWTLRETVAHLDAVALAYQCCVVAALEGRPARLEAMERREDLPRWNQREIAARAAIPVERICASFLTTLREAARLAAQLNVSELARSVATPIYSGATSVATLLGAQAAHAGLVHAAQVANGAQVKPLWRENRPALLYRQISRFFRLSGHSYWPERGGQLRATIAFAAEGSGGGEWYLAITPGEALGHTGAAAHADLSFHFANVDLLCRALTLQSGLVDALLRGKIRVRGDLGLAARFPKLFMPA